MQAASGAQIAVPLSSHVLFQSDDLDCARERVAQKFCRHRLDIVGPRRPFRACHHHAPGNMLSLNYISYGADVDIDPGELGDFYLIQMPITGAATIRNGTKEFLTDQVDSVGAESPTWRRGCDGGRAVRSDTWCRCARRRSLPLRRRYWIRPLARSFCISIR
jgi:hypothetical protein